MRGFNQIGRDSGMGTAPWACTPRSAIARAALHSYNPLFPGSADVGAEVRSLAVLKRQRRWSGKKWG
jgi:hypothetical protein